VVGTCCSRLLGRSHWSPVVQQRINGGVRGVSGGLGHGYTGSCECQRLHGMCGGSVQQRIGSRVHDMSVADSVTNTLAAANATNHTACAAGQYSNASTAACAVCLAGSATDSLAAAGAISCTACAVGRYSNASTAACTACPAGSATDTLAVAARRVSTATHRQPRARHVRRARSPIHWQLRIPPTALRARRVKDSEKAKKAVEEKVSDKLKDLREKVTMSAACVTLVLGCHTPATASCRG
jgi:hypothetical protein